MANDNQQTVTSATSSVSQTVPAVKPARLKVGMSYAVSSNVPCPAQRVIITHRYDDSRSKQIEWRFPSPSNTVNQIANLDFKGDVEVIYLRIVSGSSHPFVRADSPASSDSGSVISFVIGKVYDIIAPKYFDHKCAIIVKREGSQITWRFADGFDSTEQVSSVSSDSCSEYSWTIFNNTKLFLRADCLNLELNRLTVAKIDTATVPAELPDIQEPSDEQLTAEIKVYLGQIGQGIIEAGKRLIIMKKRLQHGKWLPWLKNNFNLSQPMASNFMRCAERFGNYKSTYNLNQTQMIEMLALPADETEAFIEAKAAAGTPVEDMTIKNLRAEIADWKRRANDAQLKNSQLEADIKNRVKTQNSLQTELAALRFDLDDAVSVKKSLQRELAAAQQDAQNAKLELQNRPIEVVPPSDYHDVKNALAAKDAEIARKAERIASLQEQLKGTTDELNAKHAVELQALDAEDYATVAQKLDAIYALITDVSNSPNAGKVIADYERNNPERYHLLCASFSDFIRIMEME